MGLLRSYMDAMLTATLSPFSSPRGSSSDSATTPKKGNKKLPSAPSVPVSATVTRSPPQRLSDFKVLETLAPALFGEVLLCLDTKTGRQFAVKRVDLRCARAQVTVGKQIRVVESLQQERAVHRRLVAAQTTNLLLLEEEVQCGGNLYLVFPFCSGGDLFDVFRVLSHGGGVRKLHRVFPRKLSDVVWDLLEKLLNVNPAKRPTLEQVAEHPFLSSEYHHTSTYNCFTR
ncbi:hypothetical protein PRIC1_001426 [Phytophthora ramorum]